MVETVGGLGLAPEFKPRSQRLSPYDSVNQHTGHGDGASSGPLRQHKSMDVPAAVDTQIPGYRNDPNMIDQTDKWAKMFVSGYLTSPSNTGDGCSSEPANLGGFEQHAFASGIMALVDKDVEDTSLETGGAPLMDEEDAKKVAAIKAVIEGSPNLVDGIDGALLGNRIVENFPELKVRNLKKFVEMYIPECKILHPLGKPPKFMLAKKEDVLEMGEGAQDQENIMKRYKVHFSKLRAGGLIMKKRADSVREDREDSSTLSNTFSRKESASRYPPPPRSQIQKQTAIIKAILETADSEDDAMDGGKVGSFINSFDSALKVKNLKRFMLDHVPECVVIPGTGQQSHVRFKLKKIGRVPPGSTLHDRYLFYLYRNDDLREVLQDLSMHGKTDSTLHTNVKGLKEWAWLGWQTSNGSGKPKDVILNTHQPFSIVIVGNRGSGKSNTVATTLESAMVSAEGVSKSDKKTTLVLDFHNASDKCCWGLGLCSPGQQTPRAPTVPVDDTVVLASPLFFRQRKKVYGDKVQVVPLLFKWNSLTIANIGVFLNLFEPGNKCICGNIKGLLREYQQRNQPLPPFDKFLEQVTCTSTCEHISLLKLFVAESEANEELSKYMIPTRDVFDSKHLILSDLTDPLLSSEDRCKIQRILTDLFQAHLKKSKILVIDDAERIFTDQGYTAKSFAKSLVEVVERMDETGTRTIFSSQSPLGLPPQLFELASVNFLHNFHSRDWATFLSSRINLPQDAFDTIKSLELGEALAVTPSMSHFARERGSAFSKVRIRRRFTRKPDSSFSLLGKEYRRSHSCAESHEMFNNPV
uniref:Uncharacterized protein n=1 Tax=Mucochytrium quahogii TaxID=96639 RepID=A0A7S2RMY0_9STRA